MMKNILLKFLGFCKLLKLSDARMKSENIVLQINRKDD